MRGIPPGLEDVMNIDPEILGGEPCFNSTRVPLDTVMDNLATGRSVDQILYSYPSLERYHVEAVLRWERDLARKAVGF